MEPGRKGRLFHSKKEEKNNVLDAKGLDATTHDHGFTWLVSGGHVPPVFGSFGSALPQELGQQSFFTAPKPFSLPGPSYFLLHRPLKGRGEHPDGANAKAI